MIHSFTMEADMTTMAIDKTASGVEKVATAYSPESGMQMEVYTDWVGIQLYTANFIVGQKARGVK